MEQIKQKLITLATKHYNTIFPCSSQTDLANCFTIENNQILFWFNTADDSTHLIQEDLAQAQDSHDIFYTENNTHLQ